MFQYLLIYSYTLKCVLGANILFINSIPSPSHQLWNHRLAVALIEKGHNITMVGPDADMFKSPSNYHPIVLEGVDEVINTKFVFEDTSSFNIFQRMNFFYRYESIACSADLETKGFKQLMDYPSNFKLDLIILDVTLAPCLHPFVQKFNYPPTIGVTAFLLPFYISYKFGNHLHPSYIPWVGNPHETNDMNFSDRIWNFICTHLDMFYREHFSTPHLEGLVRQKFGPNMDSIATIERHISLLLTNTDPNMDIVQPVTPNMIPVGGLHVAPSRELPKDLQEIVSNATNGVILFSLGTNVRSDQLSDQIRLAILSVFGKLKQTIIWKFESNIENLPENVYVRKWLPQNDILGHPNTVLFVNHGGALSTQEAIYHGVPMMGIPFYVDQFINVNNIVERKIGLRVDFSLITHEYLLQKFEEVLSNPIYSKNMKEASRRYRDQPQTALEKAVFWIEYTMRHNGAQFLNTKARDMSSFVASSADVILFLVFISICFSLILYIVTKSIVKYLLPRKVVKIKAN